MIYVSQILPVEEVLQKKKEKEFKSELFQKVLDNEIKKLQENENYK